MSANGRIYVFETLKEMKAPERLVMSVCICGVHRIRLYALETDTEGALMF